MTLAAQDGVCISQRMSQVQLETPKQRQQAGEAENQAVQSREQSGKATWGLDDNSQDLLCSQDFFWYVSNHLEEKETGEWPSSLLT